MTRRWSLSDLALARPVTVGMLLIAIVLLGAIATVRLPLAFLPAESVSQVRISVNLSANSPEVLEREVIRPLEEAVAGVRDLERIRVSSGTWGVRLNLEFRPGTDIDARKIELRERLDRARPNLPSDVQNIELVSSQGSADEPIMRVRIAGDDTLDDQYYLIQQRVIRPIERIDGVARVEMEGLEPPELEVALDLDAARSNGIALGDVNAAVRTAQRGRSLGTLRRSDLDTGVRSPGPPAEPDAFASLPVERGRAGQPGTSTSAATTSSTATTSSSGTTASTSTTTTPSASTNANIPGTTPTDPSAPISEASVQRDRHFARLGEIARVDLHPKEQRRGSRLNGRPAINLEVFADAGASPVEVSKAVRTVVERLRGDPALGHVDVAVFEDQGELILATLGDLRDTGIYGGLIGMVVLFGFLHRFRTTLIASLCVPLSVLVACGVLFVRGAELDCIVLLGLVLGVGMLIDNAVVIVEAIEQRRAQGLGPLAAAREGAREVGLATVASTMTSVIVFLPMIVGGGPSRMYTYMKPLGATFVTALVASLLVSQLAVPMLVAWRELGGREGAAASEAATPERPVRNWLLDPFARFYGRFIAWSIRHPRVISLVGLALCLSAIYPAKNMQVDMGMDEKMVAMPIRLEMTGSRGYEDVQSKVIVAEAALLERKAELGIGTLTCRFRDFGAWCDVFPAATIESEQQMSDFKQALTLVLPEQAGVRYHVGERDDWRGMNNRDPREVQFVLRGEDMATLNLLAEQLAEHLAARLPKGNPDDPDAGGYDTISGPFNEGNQELVVRLDPERLRRLGLHADEVANLVSLGFQGVGLGRVRGPAGEVELRLATGSLRDGAGPKRKGPSLADLHDLRIPILDAQGERLEIPLAAIADIELARSPFWIQRVDRQTEVRMKVRFFSSDRDHNKAMIEWAREGFVLPPGYSIGEGTPWGMERGEMLELGINLALCLILVYAVMASLFESFLQPGAILFTGLLGCFGAPWAMWATKTTFDLVAMIGLFILIGIIVNNGIMLIDKVTQLRARGVPREQALAQAGRDRLRPVLMTVLTTIFGLVPMLLHHPTLAGVYYHSIAIIIAAGLATSTIMTLVFLPSAYVLVEDFAFEARRVWRWIAGPRRRR